MLTTLSAVCRGFRADVFMPAIYAVMLRYAAYFRFFTLVAACATCHATLDAACRHFDDMMIDIEAICCR